MFSLTYSKPILNYQ